MVLEIMYWRVLKEIPKGGHNQLFPKIFSVGEYAKLQFI